MAGMMMEVRLGKKAPRFDKRTFKLSRYTAALPPAPGQAFFQSHVPEWPMMMNDTLGDCVCAAAGHMIEQWTTYVGNPVVPTDDEILKAYEVIGGYVPGDEATDNGCDMLTALNTWRKQGIAGHRIVAFAAVRQGTEEALIEDVKLSVSMFGNCYLGLALPETAQSQSNAVPGTGWHVDDSDPAASAVGSWGGHCVPAVGYDEDTVTVVTWGMLVRMSWNFLVRYCDEGYAVLSRDWIEKTRLAPSGFDFETLTQDLNSL
jgi:hypothetical protein